jgi:Na+/H+ antiporter NhaA
MLVAKTGILTASLIAGACGYLWLRLVVPDHSGNKDSKGTSK